MAVDPRLAEPLEAGQPPGGDIGEAVEAAARELPLSLRRLQIKPDRANLRFRPQQIERRRERIFEKQHVGVENEHIGRRPHDRADIDARSEAAIAPRPDQADGVIQPRGKRGVRRLAVIHDHDALRLRDAMIPDRAKEPQTSLCRAVIDDDDVEILGSGHDARLRRMGAVAALGAGVVSAVRRVSSRSRAGRQARWRRRA
jgi:hypothetical protein